MFTEVLIRASKGLFEIWQNKLIELQFSEDLKDLEILIDVGFSLDELLYKSNHILSPFILTGMATNLGACVGWFYFSLKFLFSLKNPTLDSVIFTYTCLSMAIGKKHDHITAGPKIEKTPGQKTRDIQKKLSEIAFLPVLNFFPVPNLIFGNI